MTTFEDCSFSAARDSAARALASFFAASLAARFRASTERAERLAAMASAFGDAVRIARSAGTGFGGMRTLRVQSFVHFGVVLFEPFFALLDRAAELAVLFAQSRSISLLSPFLSRSGSRGWRLSAKYLGR